MAAIVIACILDALIKDPAWAWHPVRLIGMFIQTQEKLLWDPAHLLGGGILLAATTAGTTLACGWLFVTACDMLHPAAGIAASATLIYFSISPAALASEAMKIYRLLKAGDGETAKKELSMLVGRDTRDMTRAEITRACVETVAENSVDGLIAPLFYAAIGGGPLALAYRAVNTCDSMVGYRNERYERFGKASARLDDAATFIPARIAIPLVALAALFLKLDARRALGIGLRDRLKHPSPNSAHAEAAFAGALGVRLGGLSHYGGVPKEKPMLGDARMPLEPDHIVRSVRLLQGVTLAACILFAFAARWR